MQCEICGIKESVCRARIEGSIMNVCEACKEYGEEIKSPVEKARKVADEKTFFAEETQAVIRDYARVIKDARESRKLKQEDFAKKINEKESLVHQIETGHFKPSVELARKIERYLGVRLVETAKMEAFEQKGKKEDDVLTLGHLFKK